ncbi:MAG: shikimate dehydrogenase [Sedimentisphaerales bacterium]|nr:shikimate dehydrogenase [Sedimentisphaerales bacterium]
MTYLTVPITATNLREVGEQLRRAAAGGAELLELRLDYLEKLTADSAAQAVDLAKGIGLRVLATCRSVGEGGRFSGDETALRNILAAACRAGTDYLDIELAGLERSGQAIPQFTPLSPERVILSYHNFEGLPDNLDDILYRMAGYTPGVVKVAYKAQTISDSFAALDILRAYQSQGQQAIALAMDEPGVLTRLLAKKLGAFMTFTSLDEQAASAPGQVMLAEMKNRYRWDSIGPQTRLLGIIGWPVAQSMSPLVHNAAFTTTGYNGIYLPLAVAPETKELNRFLDGLLERPWLHPAGFSVTIPHKQHALDWVRRKGGYIEPLAGRIGAANTLVFEQDGGVSAYNTDYLGAMNAILEAPGMSREKLQGLPTAVIGAGGAARAVIAGLVDARADVTIYNRTIEKAEMLAEEFDCRFAPASDLVRLGENGTDVTTTQPTLLVVNCTSVGMHPNVQHSPLPAEVISKNMLIFDTVYNPQETRLLHYARRAGAGTIDGRTMFLHQAAAQFERFTGQTPPLDLMHRLLEEK